MKLLRNSRKDEERKRWERKRKGMWETENMKRSVWSSLQQPRKMKTEANYPKKIGPSTSNTFYQWPKYNLKAGKRFKFWKFPHLFILNSVTCAQPSYKRGWDKFLESSLPAKKKKGDLINMQLPLPQIQVTYG